MITDRGGAKWVRPGTRINEDCIDILRERAERTARQMVGLSVIGSGPVTSERLGRGPKTLGFGPIYAASTEKGPDVTPRINVDEYSIDPAFLRVEDALAGAVENVAREVGEFAFGSTEETIGPLQSVLNRLIGVYNEFILHESRYATPLPKQERFTVENGVVFNEQGDQVGRVDSGE